MQNTHFSRLTRLAKITIAAGIALFFGVSANAVSWNKDDFAQFEAHKGEKKQILIIGANGSVAKVAIQGFLQGTDVDLKLYLRNSKRLSKVADQAPHRVQLIEGDALDKNTLKKAMNGVDVVYANLVGRNLGKMAQTITEAMRETGVKRLVWVGSFGVYDGEIPEYEMDRIRAYNPPHREAVKIIESSGLDYTIIRAEWFSSADEIDYELTKKGEKFKNPSAYISRKSIAHLVIRLCLDKNFGVRESLGINKPAR